MQKFSRIALAALCLASFPALAAGPMEKPEAGKLIGQRIEDTQGKKVGEISAIHINRSGKVEDVIVGVGGFLGVGERDVSIPWKKLKISEDGRKVTTEMTKDQLKDMPAYNFPAPNYRGTVFDTPPL